jgi:hypothetical protein
MNFSYSDSLDLKKQIDGQIRRLWQEGHLFSGIDSISETGIFLHKGKRIELLPKGGEKATLSDLLDAAEKELRLKINYGYPFAIVSWDSLRVRNGKLEYRMNVEQGPLIKNDSILLLSSIKTKPSYVANVIGMEPDTYYRESDFSAIPKRLERVSFLNITSKPDVSFQDQKAWVYLDLKESSTGSFQGVLGVLPNQSVEGKSLLTGNIDLSLLNLFKSGKELDFSWQKFAQESQKMEVRYKHPFLFNSKLHLETRFGLTKQDTSFINQMYELRASFYLSNRLELGFGFEQSNGNVLSSDPNRIIGNGWLDYQQDHYSVCVSTGREDVIQPKKFKNYSVKLSIGERIIFTNPHVPLERYDTISLRSTNFSFIGKNEQQWMINKRSAIHSKITLGHQSNQVRATNQLYRVGGLKTLRGFNEQFFFASTSLVSQLEWRLFFQEASFLFMFYDQGVLKIQDWRTPYGIGGGFSLQTNSGLFSFAMAMGKDKNIPLEFANMKVHFGYLSRF